jgi:hypothetical protein
MRGFSRQNEERGDSVKTEEHLCLLPRHVPEDDKNIVYVKQTASGSACNGRCRFE